MTRKRSSKKKAKTAPRSKKRAAAKSAKKKPARAVARKKSARKTASRAASKGGQRSSRRATPRARRSKAFPDTEAGDLQGLSRTESADSESVDELLEEGNAFEAGVISGVEEADGSDQREVHTHEVPEDDVPEEYLDEQ